MIMKDDSGVKELERRAKIAESSMKSAMMVGVALAIVFTALLFATKFL